MENENSKPITDSIKKEGDLIRNTGKNSVKTVKEETAKGADAITDRIKREGDLARNSGKNSIKSLKENNNINFDKFADVFKKINKSLAKQTGITATMLKLDQERNEDMKQDQAYENINKPKVTREDGSSSDVQMKGDEKKNNPFSLILPFLGLSGIGAMGIAKMVGVAGIVTVLRGPIADFIGGAVKATLDSIKPDNWDFTDSSPIVQKVGGWLQSVLTGSLTEDNKNLFADSVGTFISWGMIGRVFGKKIGWALAVGMTASKLLPFESELVNNTVKILGGIMTLFIPKLIGKVVASVGGKLLAAGAVASVAGDVMGDGKGKDKGKDKKTPKSKPRGKIGKMMSGIGSLIGLGSKKAATSATPKATGSTALKVVKGTAKVGSRVLHPVIPLAIMMNEAKQGDTPTNIRPFPEWQQENPEGTLEDYVDAFKEFDNSVLNLFTGLDDSKLDALRAEFKKRDSLAMPSPQSIQKQSASDMQNVQKDAANEYSFMKIDPSKFARNGEGMIIPPVVDIPSFQGKQSPVTEEVLRKSEESVKRAANVIIKGGDSMSQGGSTNTVTNINNYNSTDKASQLDKPLVPFAN